MALKHGDVKSIVSPSADGAAYAISLVPNAARLVPHMVTEGGFAVSLVTKGTLFSQDTPCCEPVEA